MTRQSNGESTIFRDKADRWHGYVSMGRKEDGKRDRRHVSGAKRADVAKRVRALEAQRDSGQVLASGRGWTVGKWLDHWMTSIQVNRIRPKTYQGYESKIRVHIRPALGHLPLVKLQPEHLEALYALMASKGLSGGTTLIVHNIIRRALKVALQRGRVTRNVALLVDSPVQRSTEVVPLTVADAQALLDVAQHHRNGARWSVALALGLRQGEVIGARWSDVDLDEGVWHVLQQQQRVAYRHGCGGSCAEGRTARACPDRTGGLVFSDPKTAKGKRKIGLPPQLLAQLRSHRQSQLEERLAAGSVWQVSDLVFVQPNGAPVDSRRDWQAWKALLSEAGVRDARLHDARHTAASILLAQRIPVRIVMEILGHSGTAVTENIYQHVMPEAISEATNSVADVLWAQKATTVAPSARRGGSA